MRHNFDLAIAAFLVLAFSLGGGKAAGFGLHKSVVRPALTETLNLKDFGAIGDGVTDDGPALQQALDALAAQGGGTLLVPAGTYAITTPVTKEFSSSSAVTIQGAEPGVVDNPAIIAHGLGLSSEFLIRVGETQTALTIVGAEALRLQDVTFIGDPNVNTDAMTVLLLRGINTAIIHHCEFYGLASSVEGGALVHADHCNLTVEDSAFLGSATNSGVNTSVIQNTSWRGITVTGTRFVDYGLRPELYSRLGELSPFSWISIGNAAAADETSQRREVVVRDVFLDEGAFIGISCVPGYFSSTYTPINLVFISGLTMNVTNLGASGVYLEQVEHVFIEKSFFGWSHNADSAIYLLSAGEAILDQVTCVEHAYRIRTDENTGRLTVVNSTYQYLDSLAHTTEVVTTASLYDDPVQYVRQQYLATLNHEPDPQGYFYWASLLLKCGQDQSCVTQTRALLASYLNSNPAETFTLSGQVTESDGSAVSGATITLSGSVNRVTLTNSNGGYSIADLPTDGSYTLTIARNNYVFENPSQTITAPNGDRIADFVGAMATYEISGQATTGSGAAIVATITISGAQNLTTLTDTNGAYVFTGVRAEGLYQITASRANYNFGPGTSISGLSADLIVNFSGAVQTRTISGSTGVGGVDVSLSGDTNATTQSGPDGAYSFNVDAEGHYAVSATKNHYTLTPAIYEFSNLVTDQQADFTSTLNNHVLSGVAGAAGITVTLTGDATASAVTGTGGAYAFTVAGGGNYTITPISEILRFTPGSRTFTDLSADQITNFVGTPKLQLLTEDDKVNAIALESVTLLSGPFQLTTNWDFSSDHRTRFMVFALNLSLNAGEEMSAVTVQGEDSLNHVYPLTVEFVGSVPGHPELTQLNVKVPDEFTPGGNLWISIKLHDEVSNKARIQFLP